MATLTLTAAATQAAQYLGVLDSGENLSTQQLADALLAANNLLDAWTNEQIRIIQAIVAAFTLAGGSFTAGTELQFVDTVTPLNLPSGYLRALPLNLAIEIAAQYDVPPSASLLRQAQEARVAANPLLAKVSSAAVPAGAAEGS